MNDQQTNIQTAKPETANSSGRYLQTQVLSQRPLLKAYLGDCMDLMASTADNHYDLAIVDPPYGKKPSRDGIGACKRNFSQRDNKWDIKPYQKYFNELRRVSKNQIIWGANHLLENLTETNCFIVWDKVNEKSVMADCELAWTSFQTVTKIFRYMWNGMLQEDMKNKEQRIHPTQKPVALYRWLLKNYAKAGQRILDTHGGSFSSAVACHTEGYEMDICEIDEEYYNAGIKRFKEVIEQPLFDEPERWEQLSCI